MVKRELKVNLRGFLIWTGTMLVTLLLIYLVYPSIVSDGIPQSICRNRHCLGHQ